MVIRRNPQHQFIIYEPAEHRIGAWFADCPNVAVRMTPIPGNGRIARTIAGLRYWRGAFARDALDVFEGFSLPLIAAPCHTLMTIHDLRALQAPSRIERTLARIVLRHAFARVDRVIAVSGTVRDAILAVRPATRVTVVHNGVLRHRGQECGMLPPGVPQRFVLAVGHLEARKNLPMLIDAIARLRDGGMLCPLVLAGRDGGMRASIHRQIARLGLRDIVTVVEDADDAMVRALYAACTLVAVPSSYEGFGIALIEAMAARRPLVTSDIAVFREVTEDRGRYFPVSDSASAAAAIDGVWNDPAEQARLVAYGDHRVGDFAFERLADRIAALYIPSANAMRARAAGKA